MSDENDIRAAAAKLLESDSFNAAMGAWVNSMDGASSSVMIPAMWLGFLEFWGVHVGANAHTEEQKQASISLGLFLAQLQLPLFVQQGTVMMAEQKAKEKGALN